MHTIVLPELLMVADWMKGDYLNQAEVSHRLPWPPLSCGVRPSCWTSQASSLWQLSRETVTRWVFTAQPMLSEAVLWCWGHEGSWAYWKQERNCDKAEAVGGKRQGETLSKASQLEEISVQGTAELLERWAVNEDGKQVKVKNTCYRIFRFWFCSRQCSSPFWNRRLNFSAAPALLWILKMCLFFAFS